EANTPGTGGFIDAPNQRLGIFHQSPITTPHDLAEVALEPGTSAGGGTEPTTAASSAPAALGDVANVVEDHQPLIGDSSVGGRPGLLLVVQKFPDANVVDVTRGVDKALDALAPGLRGVTVDRGLFRPATYIETSTRNLLIALIVGVAILLLLLAASLSEWRGGAVAAAPRLPPVPPSARLLPPP